MSKKLLCLLLLGIAITGCTGNVSTSTPPQTKLYPDEIVIGYIDFIGYAPLLIAEDKGFYQETGLNVKVKHYDDFKLLSEDYTNQKILGKANISMSAVQEAINGFPQKVVQVIDYSNGADAIIAQKSIASMKDLKGKKVGYPKGFMEEFIVQWIFKEYGLNLTDIISVNEDLGVLIEKLQTKEIDAIPMYEPLLSELLEKNPDLHEIYTSASSPALITDVLTFSADFTEEYPETVQAIVDANFKAVKFLEDHPEEAYGILAKRFNQSPETVKKVIQKIVILDKLANRSAFNENDNIQSIHENMKALYFFIKGFEANRNFINSLIDTRFVE